MMRRRYLVVIGCHL